MESSELNNQLNKSRSEEKNNTITRSGVDSWLNRFARKLVLKKLNDIKHGQIIINENGKQYHFGRHNQLNSHLIAKLEVLTPEFYKHIMLNGSIGAGEAYMQGFWKTDDLTNLIRLFSLNTNATDSIDSGIASVLKPFEKMYHWFNRNSVSGSKRNISAHYDLGNEMYRCFLDPSMMYSSAIYPDKNMSLNDASEYKLKHICDKLDLQAEHHLLEIGTGWGGMAIFAAKYTGCKVTTTTISQAQFDYATQAVKDAGLTEQIKVIMFDYRELKGQYDRLVSVEMIEAVGHEYYPVFFQKCAQLLKPDGVMLIQAITIADQRFDYYLNNVDFIQKYIFPGGCLPSVEQMAKQVSQSSDMVIRHLEDIGLHYAQTLADWRDNFFQNIEQIKSQGYDDQFIRMWEFYLCYCEGGFRERAISTVQLVLNKPDNRSDSPLINHYSAT